MHPYNELFSTCFLNGDIAFYKYQKNDLTISSDDSSESEDDKPTKYIDEFSYGIK